MKRNICIILSLLMLLTVVLTATSCDTEPVTGFTQLRDHLIETVGENTYATLDGSASGLTSVTLSTGRLDDGTPAIRAVAYAMTQGYVLQVTLTAVDADGEWDFQYELLDSATGEALSTGYATLDGAAYTGDTLIAFETVDNITVSVEMTARQNATALTNGLLLSLDNYLATVDMSLDDLGLTALSNKYRAPVTEVETEEDLGGAFSAARLAYAGRMTVLGLGMVFGVLSVLWLVLLIFKSVATRGERKPTKATDKEAGETDKTVEKPIPVPAPAEDAEDPATVAAITAAVAAMIASDPSLSSQFEGGFRVVSFKKTNGRTARNR